jgi:UDP-2,3-diacylglucosamine hydrolase
LVKPLGLIAGNGQFPLLMAEQAKRQNRPVVAVAIKEETDPRLETLADRLQWIDLGQIKKTLAFFRQEGVEEAVMVGQVRHNQLYRRLRLDTTAIKLLATLRDKKTDTILGAVADVFAEAGIRLLPSTTYLQDLLAPQGVLSSTKPNGDIKKDIAFGFQTAKSVAGLDLGQTVCVKDKAVVAVEAMEGTDACIRRAGDVCGGGFTIVKVAKPKQDLRFDVPVIGEQTVQTMKDAQAAALAVEAGKTLFFDKEKFLADADRAGLIVVGVAP